MNTERSIYDVFGKAVLKWPDRPFLNVLPETAGIYGIGAGEITYKQAYAQIKDAVTSYNAAGLRAGDRVLVLMENRPAFFLHWIALNALGVVIVPINPDLQSSELEYIGWHAEPVLAVCIDARRPDLERAAQDSEQHFPVAVLGEELPVLNETCAKDDYVAKQGDPAAMLYTSGTTGSPKGCVLSNLYFLEAGHWYANAGGICSLSEDGERMITPLPIFHMNAMTYSAMAMIAVGGCLTVLDRFHPRSWWQNVRDANATCLHYLGVMPSILMSMPNAPEDKAHSARFGFGAGIDAKLHIPFEERFDIPLVEAWAMTETGAGSVIAANTEPRKRGMSCLGHPGPEMDVCIMGDDGTPIEGTEPGELLVRRKGSSPRAGFFSSYFKDEAATLEAWEGGWFHTGDIVRRDTDGDFFFVDRKKNVIRRSGENIAAVDVESVLMQHPDIEAVAVCPVPDPIRENEVFASIVWRKDKTQAQAEEIVRWGLERMAYYKVPGFISFSNALPLTSTQKIHRATLKQQALELLDNSMTFNTTHLKRRQLVS
ncbi:AMP-binding protein [Pseudovibrio sp. Tun.PSC04-5.I4]|uniref:AMP-binding protein n=1 Tax=Pseudovibrio sp. Tun.PSC04-5.I4 TaxID=1798213 RepID=UPI000882C40D|nr:AMP-binding protein [Pseudovibrio sp. Tun.PSC04-5.I4]SDQ97328.1 Acyl-CoA synthetase (AMP-forming)/AMP-acid ligase II [Pseudovibrio sp. Tun.PSC04-5.I4]